jgi:hypothetical protein
MPHIYRPFIIGGGGLRTPTKLDHDLGNATEPPKKLNPLQELGKRLEDLEISGMGMGDKKRKPKNIQFKI